MESIEKQVIEWHREQFSWATIGDIEDKLDEELEEFYMAAVRTTLYFSTDSIEEFADMCIVMMAGLAKSGKPSLTDHIAKKLAINKGRTWNKDGSRDK